MNTIDLAAIRRARLTGASGVIRPHRPDDRIVVETVSATCAISPFADWEVRIFDPAGQFHHYFASRALLHVQFWNPFFGISILSPSRLTGFKYEAFPLDEWKYAAADYEAIAARCGALIGARLPDAARVRRICRAYAGETPRVQPRAPKPAHESMYLVR